MSNLDCCWRDTSRNNLRLLRRALSRAEVEGEGEKTGRVHSLGERASSIR